MSLSLQIGFIGFGKMGFALASGAVRSKVLKASQVSAYDVDALARKKIKQSHFFAAKSMEAVVQRADVVFLCVKPQQMKSVFEALRRSPSSNDFSGTCFVSIAAGVSLSTLEKGLGKKTALIRVMPNTPALLNSGMSVMAVGPRTSQNQVQWVKKILEGVGKVLILSDAKMDAVTAVSGSGPAYAFYLAESMMEAAQKLGLSTAEARTLVHQTLYGAGQMLGRTNENAGTLRKNVTSPGGTTEAALKEFERKHVRAQIVRGIQKAAQRSKQLSKI